MLAIIQQEARKAAEAVYNENGTKYGVAQVPAHSHNGVDSVQIDPSGMTGFNFLSSQGNGVLSPTNIGDRIVFWNQAKIDSGGISSPLGYRSQFPTFPLVIINGDLGEESLPFQGGEAPDGTLIAYKTGDQWQLWFRLWGTWHGISFGAGGTPALSLETSN